MARRGNGLAILLIMPIEIVFMRSDDPWSLQLHRVYKVAMDEAGIAGDYRVSMSLAELQVYRGIVADLLILVNHGGSSEVTLKIPRDVES